VVFFHRFHFLLRKYKDVRLRQQGLALFHTIYTLHYYKQGKNYVSMNILMTTYAFRKFNTAMTTYFSLCSMLNHLLPQPAKLIYHLCFLNATCSNYQTIQTGKKEVDFIGVWHTIERILLTVAKQ
jgi:hypothetical protein